MGVDAVIQTVLESGGLLGLAVFAIWMLNRVWSRWESMAIQNQEVIKANTEAITTLCVMLRKEGEK